MDGEYLDQSLERLSEALKLLKADYAEARERLGTLLWYLAQRDAATIALNYTRASVH